MSATFELIVILCTVPDEATAERLARGLIDANLAACVNALPGVRSYYRWEGETRCDGEVQLLIKTRRARFDDVAGWITTHHPYEVPELVALSASRVGQSYLAWALEQTR